ncbi:hypothetical protein Rhal01_03539 [Rubritalea halochordaticola]|uniref:Zinc-ribbon domain-containing protein n=1 Tax=Rubritalea halochordaticola TaxID=714537 RepID=A0ABP9V8F7_9BACT
MALIQCSECSNQVSSEAKICPHCGFKLRKIRDSKLAKDTKAGLGKGKEWLVYISVPLAIFLCRFVFHILFRD